MAILTHALFALAFAAAVVVRRSKWTVELNGKVFSRAPDERSLEKAWRGGRA